MSKILITGASASRGEWQDYPSARLLESAAHDTYKVHTLTEDPAEADIILFATNDTYPPAGLALFREPLYHKFPKKCVRFDSGDYPSPVVGGLCASWPQSRAGRSGSAVGWTYYHPSSAEPFIEELAFPENPKFLWSFVGSRSTHPIRGSLLTLRDDRAWMEDTSTKSIKNLMRLTAGDEQAAFLENYKNVLRESCFVLCPRGVGASSMRIFEAMRGGRCPVIISDDWTPPPFIDWNSCSLRIPEQKVAQLPTILRDKEPQYRTLGKLARSEWRRVFGQTALFHHTVEACKLVLSDKPLHEFRNKMSYIRLAETPHRQALLRSAMRTLGAGKPQ